MKAKNVLIVIPSLTLGGGAERVASSLADYFSVRGYKITLLTFYKSTHEYPCDSERITINENHSNSILHKLIKLVTRAHRINLICKDKKIDLVISFMEEANFSAILSRKILGNKCKLLVLVRDNPKKYSKNVIYFNLMKKLYPLADRVITNSMHMESILNQHLNITNTNTIYNPIDVLRIKRMKEQKLPRKYDPLFRGGFNVINIGRLAEQKGQCFLIRSFAEFVKTNKDARLIILGDGE
ncbi:MAG: glycosyltransferase, partial [Nanoarchaeota archaeon]|nr:glycosyltransferase [Nanoarchaeota archaeon]